MTKPTQAQIEAAAKAAYSAACDDEDGYTWQDYIPVAKAALTAAADVGEHTYTQSQLDDVVKRTWSATIELCAQVAESTTYMSGAHIAAAIRGLKDKP